MTRNLFSRRKSILQKTHNFLAKGKIISPCSSVSFERGGRKRYIKKTQKTEFKKQHTKGRSTYGTRPSIHCELLHTHSSNAPHCIMSTSSDSQVFTEKHFDILWNHLLQLLGKSWTGWLIALMYVRLFFRHWREPGVTLQLSSTTSGSNFTFNEQTWVCYRLSHLNCLQADFRKMSSFFFLAKVQLPQLFNNKFRNFKIIAEVLPVHSIISGESITYNMQTKKMQFSLIVTSL